MTETISILIQISYFIFLSLFPLNAFNNRLSYFSVSKLSFIDKLSANTIININVLFILSLLKISFLIIFYFQIIFGTVFLIFFLKNQKEFNYKDIYILVIILIINFILSIVIASNLILGWDSDFRWIMKALNFVQGNNVDNLYKFSDNEYPFLGSLIWGYFWKNSLLGYEYFGRLFYIYLFILSIFSLSEILNFKLNYRICVTISLIFLGFKYVHFNGYQDILIFSIICFISKILFCYLYDEKKQTNKKFKFELILLILLFNILFWIKNEGMIYSFFFLILFLFFSKNYKSNLFLIVFTILILIFKVTIYDYLNLPFIIQGITYDKSIFEFDFETLLSRFFLVSKFYFFFIFDNRLMLISLISLILIFTFQKNLRYLKFFLIFFLLNMSFIYGSNLFMNLPNVDYWITFTIPRFMLHTTGFYLLAFFIFCNIRLSRFLK